MAECQQHLGSSRHERKAFRHVWIQLQQKGKAYQLHFHSNYKHSWRVMYTTGKHQRWPKCGWSNPNVFTVKLQQQHTLTGRCTLQPRSISLTCAKAVSLQVVACITTVGGSLSKCCSSSVTNLAIDGVCEGTTVHNCQKKECITYTESKTVCDCRYRE